MALHNEVGLKGEVLAEKYFTDRGYTVLFRNWRYLRCEIDLILTKNEVLHIVEVKTRRTQTFGYPEEAVNTKKLRRLIKAGAAFLQLHPQWKRVQYNILSINIYKNKTEYFLIEDVYI